MNEKNWIITIGIDKFYLTQGEVDFYLHSLAKGSKYVKIGEDKVLGSNFQSLVRVSTFEETKMLSEGRWQCAHGKWHVKGWQCFCEKLLPEQTDEMESTGFRPAKLVDENGAFK